MCVFPKKQADESAKGIEQFARAVASVLNGVNMQGLDIKVYRPCFSCQEPDFSFTDNRIYYDGSYEQRAKCSKESICKRVDGLVPLDLNEGTVDAMHNLNRCVAELNEVLGTELLPVKREAIEDMPQVPKDSDS